MVMALAFHAASGLVESVAFDPESFTCTALSLIDSDTGVLMVADDDGDLCGVIGGIVYPHYFNVKHLTGQEMFWWVNPDSRSASTGKHLLNALHNWAESKGVETFMMVSLEQLNPVGVGKLYMRHGYTPVEHSYMRTF